MPGMVNTTIMVDSKKEKLNSFEIVHATIEAAQNNSVPLAGQLAAATAELTMPNARVQQIGNTLFVAHVASEHEALIKAFNADTEQNFVTNMREFCKYVNKKLGIDTVYVQGMEDQKLASLITAVFSTPGVSYKVTPGAQPMAVAQLGTIGN